MLQSQSTDELVESINGRTGRQVTAAGVQEHIPGCYTQMQKGEVREYSENGYVKRICFSTYEQIQLYNKNPEVVCIDSTYNFNHKM